MKLKLSVKVSLLKRLIWLSIIKEQEEQYSGGICSHEHFYRTQVFYSIIDVILSELNHRFPTNVTDLLTCASAFDPRDNFEKYDEKKLKKLATLSS